MFHLIVMFQDTSVFAFPTEAGNEIEGVIMLKAPINGITRHDIMVCVTMMSSTSQHCSFGSRNLTFLFMTIILQLKICTLDLPPFETMNGLSCQVKVS